MKLSSLPLIGWRAARFVVAVGIVVALAWSFALAQTPYMVKDINPSTDLGSSNPSQFVQVGNKTFFVTSVPNEGVQLWKTDGSGSGTSLVIDKYFTSISSMTASNGRLFFVTSSSSSNFSGSTVIDGTGLIIYNSLSQAELWTSDGTAAGTVKLRNADSTSIADMNGALFFASDDGAYGHALWKTDGTTAGTTMVFPIPATCAEGSADCLVSLLNSPAPTSLMPVNGTLFFVTGTSTLSGPVLLGNTVALWKSDGTQAGTMQLMSGTSFSPTNLTNVNGVLYFSSPASDGTISIWKSDGTVAGTVEADRLLVTRVGEFTNVNGTLFFDSLTTSATSGSSLDLWKSDGTAAGTGVVTNVCNADGSTSTCAVSASLTEFKGSLFYSAQNGLWKTDGTAEGTAQVASGMSPASLVAFNGSLYFAGYDSNNGRELWKSDGTANGTMLVKDVCPGTCGGVASANVASLRSGDFTGTLNGVGSTLIVTPTVVPAFTVSNGKLYFIGCEPVNACEPWTSDGTTGGTTLLKNIVVNTTSQIMRAIDMNGTLLFSAYDSSSEQLFRSDGTDAGTTAFKAVSRAALGWTTVQGGALFAMVKSTGGYDLWKTDGTATGTVLIKSFLTMPGSGYTALGNVIYSSPSFVSVNGTAYFAAADDAHGTELWKSDGTADGTVIVKDINAGANSSSPSNLTEVNGTLLFAADDGSGEALWKSDGTASGTVLVKVIPPPTNVICSGGCNLLNEPTEFARVGNMLFFATRFALWKSDGTEAGTVAITPTSGLVRASDLTDVNGTLFFLDSGNLWKSDGTNDGTVVVRKLSSGSTFSSSFNNIVPASSTTANVNGEFFFLYNSALWKSDGTEAGTVVVKDAPSYGLTSVGGKLYFRSTDANGAELWKTDGTPEGTVIVADINPGANGSFPYVLGTSHGKIYFTANDGSHGTELWALDVAPTSVALTTSKNVTVVGGSITLTATVTSTVAGTPTGPVKFMDGATVLGTVAVDASGVATYATTSLAAGTHSITAVYGGDAKYANSTSTVVSQVVLATAPDYTLAANPTSATVRAGESATFVITATADQYFNGTVTFSCGTLPTGVSCSFSPTTLTPTNGHPAQTTLVVSTTSQTAALTAPEVPVRHNGGILLAVLGGSGVFGCVLLGRSRKQRLLAALALVVLLGLGLTACGGGGGSKKNPNGTPSGAATVQVTATATTGTTGANTAAHPLLITVNVQ